MRKYSQRIKAEFLKKKKEKKEKINKEKEENRV